MFFNQEFEDFNEPLSDQDCQELHYQYQPMNHYEQEQLNNSYILVGNEYQDPNPPNTLPFAHIGEGDERPSRTNENFQMRNNRISSDFYCLGVPGQQQFQVRSREGSQFDISDACAINIFEEPSSECQKVNPKMGTHHNSQFKKNILP